MSKKTFMATIAIIGLIVSLTAGIQVVRIVEANPLPPSWMNPHMTITIQSPTNETNNAVPVFVNFTAQSSNQFYLSTNESDEWFRSFFYVLDGQSMTTEGIMFTQIQGGSTFTGADQNFSGQTHLTGLTEGLHTITVYWGVNTNYPSPPPNENVAYDASWSAIAQFYVDPQMTPSPTLSPSPIPTPYLSPSPTLVPPTILTPTPSPAPSEPPTRQPTLEPSPTPNSPQENSTSIFIIVALFVVVVAVVAGSLFYFMKKNGRI